MPNYNLTYGVAEVSRILNVDRDIVKTWVYKFADYLSVGAKPSKGSIRQFTIDDICVFSYVSMYWEENPDIESIEIGLNRNEHHEFPYSELKSSITPIFREFTDDFIESNIPMIGGIFSSINKFTLADSYRFAGDTLIDSAIEKNEESELLYPIIFNYRHAVELYLKSILSNKKKTHDLLKLYQRFKILLQKEFETTPPDWFENIIFTFNDFDPAGEVFRYGEDILRDEMLVDLSHLKLKMSWLAESFQNIKNRKQNLTDKNAS